MRQLLIQMKPRSVTDIMVAIALYRPGPMDSIPRFLKNRSDMASLTYKIPCLKDILDETCGCIVYQEQVMQVFREVAGYTYGKADVVRRAIAKKKPGVIEQERENFIKGAVNNGYDAVDADELYSEMTDFANYGFKKSHAAAYAFISYQSAYLKTHFAPMYYASLISSVFGNQSKMSEYITECSKMGIKTLPPDINESGTGFSVSNGNIRYGLPAIKNVGAQFIQRVVNERRGRPFASFYDFVSRMQGSDLNRRQVESLIKAGAFDSLGVYRSQLLAVCNDVIESCQRHSHSGVAGQMDLFSSDTVEVKFPDIPEFSLKERLRLERESAGMYLSGHILDGYSKHYDAISPVTVRSIIDDVLDGGNAYRDKQVVKVAGVVTGVTRKNTKSGELMYFISLEDRSSECEIIVFPKSVIEYRPILEIDSVIAVEGEISLKDGELKLILRRALALTDDDSYKGQSVAPKIAEVSRPAATEVKPSVVADEKPKRLYIKVPDMTNKAFKRALSICEIFEGDVQAVFYDVSKGKYVSSNVLVDATPYVVSELSQILGDGCVILK